MMLPQFYMDDLIRQAIREDINYIDTSADYLIPPDQMGKARFLAKADGVLCGLSVALRVFELLDPAFRAQRFHADGDTLQKGDIIAELSGSTAMLLKGERTALNLIQHMSGIATATAQAVRLVEGTHASITDTRKHCWPRSPQNMQSSAAAVKTTVTTSPTARCSRITTSMPPVASPTRSLFCVESLAIW